MIRLGKRRLLRSISLCTDWNRLILQLEAVDNELNISSKLVLSHPSIIIYGHKEEDPIKVGREIIGFDSDYRYHEVLMLEDYFPVQAEEYLLNFSEAREIGVYLTQLFNKNIQFDSFRVELNHFEDARIFLYKKL